MRQIPMAYAKWSPRPTKREEALMIFRRILDDYMDVATNNGRKRRNIPYRN